MGIAWLTFLLPLPGLGVFVGWPLNLVAFILAIVAMVKGRTTGGLVSLICSIVISPIVYLIGLAFFAAAVADVGSSMTDASKSQATLAETSKVQSSVEVTARQLFNDYNANEVAADNSYRNQTLLVTGKVESVNKDVFDKIYVSLETGEPFSTVDARGLNAEETAALGKGQSITVICKGDGLLIGSPQLKNCRLR